MEYYYNFCLALFIAILYSNSFVFIYYLIARLFGIKVVEIVIFGGKIIYEKTIGDVLLRIGTLPHYSSVQLSRMVLEEYEEIEDLQPHDFLAQALWKKLCINYASLFSLIIGIGLSLYTQTENFYSIFNLYTLVFILLVIFAFMTMERIKNLYIDYLSLLLITVASVMLIYSQTSYFSIIQEIIDDKLNIQSAFSMMKFLSFWCITSYVLQLSNCTYRTLNDIYFHRFQKYFDGTLDKLPNLLYVVIAFLTLFLYLYLFIKLLG